MKLDTLIDIHQRKCKVQAKAPKRPSVRPSVRLALSPLLILWMHASFFHDFYIDLFVGNHLLGNTKLSFLILFKSYRPCREKALHFSLFFAFFVENHLLWNTKPGFLVL